MILFCARNEQFRNQSEVNKTVKTQKIHPPIEKILPKYQNPVQNEPLKRADEYKTTTTGKRAADVYKVECNTAIK